MPRYMTTEGGWVEVKPIHSDSTPTGANPTGIRVGFRVFVPELEKTITVGMELDEAGSLGASLIGMMLGSKTA